MAECAGAELQSEKGRVVKMYIAVGGFVQPLLYRPNFFWKYVARIEIE